MDKQIASLKAEQKGVKSQAPVHTPTPPAKTEAPTHESPAPASHTKPHG